MNGLNGQVASLAANVGTFGRAVDHAHQGTQRFRENVGQLQSVLDQFVALLRRNILEEGK